MTHKEIYRICEKYAGSIPTTYNINEDMSISVDLIVDLYDKHLTEIPIKFKEVSSSFDCSNNKLTSLKNCPERVGNNFYCYGNQLTTLEYCPDHIGNNFYCNSNNLKTLDHFPISVGGDSYCENNQLTNFDGLPEFFEQTIYLLGNPVHEIYKLFNEDPRCIYWLREYDVIMDMTVVGYRLEEVFHTLEMEVPKDIILKEYILI